VVRLAETSWAPALLVAAAAIAIYLGTLSAGFVVDDLHQVVDNAWVTDPALVPEIFSSGVWEFEGRLSSYYRPFMYLIYLATYLVFGLEPWGFHLVNVLAHAGVSVLVFGIARRLAAAAGPEPRAFPLLAGLLFATHPIHTEPVAWVAGMADLGLALFGLLALWLHARARAVSSAAALLAAALCKETAVVLPLALGAWDLLFREGGRRWRRTLRGLVPHAVALAVYFGLRYAALGGIAPTVGDTGLGVAGRIGAGIALFGRYLEKLALPVGLNFWHVFRPPEGLFSADLVAPAVWIAGFAAAAATASRRGGTPAFASILIVLPLLPALHVGALNQGISNAFTERYLYLPSAGFALLVAWGASRLGHRGRRGTVVAAVAMLAMLAAYSAGTVRRTPVWRNSLTLWQDAVTRSPGSAIARMNHGYALMYDGQDERGRQELREAVRLDPEIYRYELDRGAAYARKGLLDKAMLAFHAALALDPGCAPAYFNLALLYEQQGRRELAETHYRRALALDPGYAEAHNNLGILLAGSGRFDEAAFHFETAVRLDPGDRDYRDNLERARGLGSAPPPNVRAR